MGNTLTQICDRKREHVADRRSRMSEAMLLAAVTKIHEPRGFLAALESKVSAGQPALIAEVKKASPSRGVIRADFVPAELAQAYEKGGATCLSVLTDEPYFQGHDKYVGEVRRAARLPVLRKDFIIDTYQVAESRAIGADCILLIMAAIDDSFAAEAEAAAHELGMDVLVEVHDERELERALKLKTKLVGVNNRNLKTMEIDISTTERLSSLIPAWYLKVCESGIHTNADLRRIRLSGVHTFLVGESLMKQPDVEVATRVLLG